MFHHSLARRACTRGLLALSICAAPFAPSALAQAAKIPTTADDSMPSWSDLISGNSMFTLYGFVRLDTAFNDSRFNDPQIPGFVQSEDPTAPANVGAPDGQQEFTMHARLTRLGLTFDGPTIEQLHGAKVGGRVEVDFYNIGIDSDSRNALRMRRAYLDLSWDHWRVLAGQEWDLFSPLYPAVNADLVMWGAGNLGDRRPYLRGTYTTDAAGGRIIADFGLGLGGAVENRRTDSTTEGGLSEGEASARPLVAARLGYENDDGLSFGIWGHESKERFNNDGNGEQTFDSYSAGVDVNAPFGGGDSWIKGEAWFGENVDDVRGGIFQGVNDANREIASRGGFVEFGHRLTDSLTISVGQSIDDPDDDDLDANHPRARNSVQYAAFTWKWEDVKMGLEVLNWQTKYFQLDEGDALRLAWWISYTF